MLNEKLEIKHFISNVARIEKGLSKAWETCGALKKGDT